MDLHDCPTKDTQVPKSGWSSGALAPTHLEPTEASAGIRWPEALKGVPSKAILAASSAFQLCVTPNSV